MSMSEWWGSVPEQLGLLQPLEYIQLCSSSSVPWVCIPSWHTGSTASIVALPPPDNITLYPSCHSYCSAAWDKNMPQSRKSNLQKKNILKGGLRNLLVLSQCWMVGLSCRFWGRYPQGHPLEVTCPKDICIQDLMAPADVRHHQLIGGKISHFLEALCWAPISLTKLGHKIRIWPSLFPGGPFLLENFVSVEDQREHSPTHSTQCDLKMTHDICPDILSKSYILPLHSFLMAGRKCWGQNQVSISLSWSTSPGMAKTLIHLYSHFTALNALLRVYLSLTTKNQEEMVFQSMTRGLI